MLFSRTRASQGTATSFHKSLLVGVNVANSWLEEASNVLYNRGGIVPFKYFGHLIGSNPCRIAVKSNVLVAKMF
jgi:hypothetical protein